MKNIKYILFILATLFLAGCGGDACVTCTKDSSVLEACDGDGVTYTDQNGNPIPYDEFAKIWEALGYTCEE